MPSKIDVQKTFDAYKEQAKKEWPDTGSPADPKVFWREYIGNSQFTNFADYYHTGNLLGGNNSFREIIAGGNGEKQSPRPFPPTEMVFTSDKYYQKQNGNVPKSKQTKSDHFVQHLLLVCLLITVIIYILILASY